MLPMQLQGDPSGEKIRARQEPRPAGKAGRTGKIFFAALVILLFGFCMQAQQRFPPPEFESGHQIPVTAAPAARGLWFQYQDVVVLMATLALSSWLVYQRRSRKSLIALSIFSLAYFGFYRKGCICAIGSVQNAALALCDSSYALPASVLVFFLLPLVFTLFLGRTFCAAVCPHGALQDLLLLKPLKVPEFLEQGLSVLPFVYLGAGVLFAGAGSAFVICQYDPFVPVFRMSGRTLMVLSGIALLVLAVFIGRPYCRFLCPYGALLKLAATLAKRRVRVTPDHCTQCRLCEASCPFGALREPQEPQADLADLRKDRRRLVRLLGLLPVLVLSGGFLGTRISTTASRMHPTVSLAERFLATHDEPPKTGVLSPDDLALDRARQHPEQILEEARALQRKFSTGAWLFGAWIGAVVGIKLVSLSLHRRRKDYEPSQGECLACARCFEFCPNEMVRRGISLTSTQNETDVATIPGTLAEGR
jgi:polyferredoxin